MTAKKRTPKSSLPRSPFASHLSELRARVLVYLLVLIAASIVGYAVHPQILAILTLPLGAPLFTTSVTGGIDIVLHVSLLFGFLFSTPLLFFQIYRFVAPALPPIPSVVIIRSALVSLILLVIGFVFGYSLALPATLRFLMTVAPTGVNTLLSASEYLGFVMIYLLGFGLAFQLPLLLLVLDSIRPLELKKLWEGQRIVIVGCFILAAILTPTPDIINQAILAVPLIVLYQISLLLLWWQHRLKKRVSQGK